MNPLIKRYLLICGLALPSAVLLGLFVAVAFSSCTVASRHLEVMVKRVN